MLNKIIVVRIKLIVSCLSLYCYFLLFGYILIISSLNDYSDIKLKRFVNNLIISYVYKVINPIQVSSIQNQMKKSSKKQINEFIRNYKTYIRPHQFTMKEVNTLGSFTFLELDNIGKGWITQQKMKQLLIDIIKVQNRFHHKICTINQALQLTLQNYVQISSGIYLVENVIKILIQGQLYQYLSCNKNQIKYLINNRTTAMNINVAIAVIIVYISKRLNVGQINNAIWLFTLQQAVLKTSPFGLPAQISRIEKCLKKINRSLNGKELKNWFQNLQKSIGYRGFIELHHFMYLVALSQKNFIDKQHNFIFKFKQVEHFRSNKENSQHFTRIGHKIDEQNHETRLKIDRTKNRVKGLTFYQQNSQKSMQNRQLYKDIKRSISNKSRPKSSLLQQSMQNRKKQFFAANIIIPKRSIIVSDKSKFKFKYKDSYKKLCLDRIKKTQKKQLFNNFYEHQIEQNKNVLNKQ